MYNYVRNAYDLNNNHSSFNIHKSIPNIAVAETSGFLYAFGFTVGTIGVVLIIITIIIMLSIMIIAYFKTKSNRKKYFTPSKQ